MAAAIINFKDIRKGTVFLGKIFTFSAHPEGQLEKVELLSDGELKFDSNEIGGITIEDPTNWVFKIDEQIINFPSRQYNFVIYLTDSIHGRIDYFKGAWMIVGNY